MQTFLFPSSRKAFGATLLAAIFTMVVLPVAAQSSAPSPEAAGSVQFRVPEAALSASASTEVEQDTVRITLSAQVSDANRETVSRNLDKTLQGVISKAKVVSAVDVSSGNYRVWPEHTESGKIKGWQGRADVMLESTDFAVASELAGQLSGQMAISNLYFFVSRKARESAEAGLLAQAANAFTQRAQAVAESFGYHGFRVKSLNLDGSGPDFSPMPRMMMAAAPEKTAPPLEPGVDTVTVSVRGVVYLLPASK